MIPIENRDGSARHDSPHGILADDRVRYVGHPVVLVVAETAAQARDAAERIAVEYEELPVTIHTEHSTSDDAPLLYDHIPNNLIYDWHKGDEDGVEAALARADHVCELRLVNNRVVANPMEPRSALAVHDAASGRTTLAASTQGPSLIRDILAQPVFGIDPSHLRVTTGHVGGGFGMKVFPHAEQALAIWAARRLKRPVKWPPNGPRAFSPTSRRGTTSPTASWAWTGTAKSSPCAPTRSPTKAPICRHSPRWSPVSAWTCWSASTTSRPSTRR